MAIEVKNGVLCLWGRVALGSHLISTPFFRTLSENLNGKNVGIVTNFSGVNFFRVNPYGINVHYFESSINDARMPEVLGTLSKIKSGLYDVAVVLPETGGFYTDLVVRNGLPFKDRIASRSSARHFGGYISGYPLYTGFPDKFMEVFGFNTIIDSDERSAGSSTYIGDQLLEYLKPFGFMRGDNRPDIWSSAEDALAIRSRYEGKGVTENDFVLGFNLGAHNHIWDISNFENLIRSLASDLEGGVGGRQVKFACSYASYEISLFMDLQEKLRDMELRGVLFGIENKSMGELKEAIAGMDYLITSETGTAHVAQSASVDVPSTVLYPSQDWMETRLCPHPGVRIAPLVSSKFGVNYISPEEVRAATLKGLAKWCR